MSSSAVLLFQGDTPGKILSLCGEALNADLSCRDNTLAHKLDIQIFAEMICILCV